MQWSLLGLRQPRIHGPPGFHHQPLAVLDGSQPQHVIQRDAGSRSLQPEAIGSGNWDGFSRCLDLRGKPHLLLARVRREVRLPGGEAQRLTPGVLAHRPQNLGQLVLLQEASDQRISGQHAAFRRWQPRGLPACQGHMPLKRQELLERLGEPPCLPIEAGQVRQPEIGFGRIPVPHEVAGYVLQRLKPSPLERHDQVTRRLPVRLVGVFFPWLRLWQISPCCGGVFQRQLAVEARAARGPRLARAIFRRQRESAQRIEHALAEDLAERLRRVPVKALPVRESHAGQRLQRLADHWVILLLADIAIEKCHQ